MAILQDVNQFTPSDDSSEYLDNFNAIFQGISNLINTRKKERLFNLNFGLEIEEELFEFVDDASAFDLLRIIANELAENEPRVRFLSGLSKVTADPDNNRYLLDLAFEPVGDEGQVVTLKGSLTI